MCACAQKSGLMIKARVHIDCTKWQTETEVLTCFAVVNKCVTLLNARNKINEESYTEL